MAAYCHALEKEIVRMGEKYPNAEIATVFLGGGTPTLVPPGLMEGVLQTLRRSFVIHPDAEFTSEGNPGTLAEEWLDMAQRCGLNRLSLGVQAAQDRLLQTIGRIHSFARAEEAVRLARKCGIRNLNLDAMFGLPGQTERDYLHTLQAFRDLGAEHISAYSLILEENTPLFDQVEAGQLSLPQEDDVAAMYEHGIDWLEQAGYERYEVSNFAKPGHACRHNIGYWQGEWYLGLGVAAHSMLPPASEQRERGIMRIRRANAADVAAYIRADGQAPAESIEEINAEETMFETMMVGLRTRQGVQAERFRRQFGMELQTAYDLDDLIRDGFGAWRGDAQGGRWFALTPRGIEVQNEVLLRLMK